MKNYGRSYPYLSLCGLNCSLCTMHLSGYCPGCGGGEGNQPCSFFKCAGEHGSVEFCYMCESYPCEKYDHATEFDSFITHQNMIQDSVKARQIGKEAYKAEQEEKAEILKVLMDNYSDGRRKTVFSIAVNLLELQDIREVMEHIKTEINPENTGKEKAAAAAGYFQAAADRKGVVLKLRKKPSTPSGQKQKDTE